MRNEKREGKRKRVSEQGGTGIEREEEGGKKRGKKRGKRRGKERGKKRVKAGKRERNRDETKLLLAARG